ncbi:MAG TPA: hypothetical protein VKA67_10300, partial [Verrucomicrobiae bacterium]|nr:hypothetical protein [Verrucomicrobiae bacterium]
MNGASITSTGELPAATRERRLLTWVSTVDHKRIGILYLVTTFVFLLIGGVEALVMRLQLAVPN